MEEYSDLEFKDVAIELMNKSGITYSISGEELRCCCPFHKDGQEKHPSFGINLRKGVYNCFTCDEHGNMADLVSKIEGISYAEALTRLGYPYFEVDYKYTLGDYAQEKNLDWIILSKKFGLDTVANGVKIPYRDEDGHYLGCKIRHGPNSEPRFSYEKGTKTTLYGLWALDKMSSEYIILVEGESDCHCAWTYDMKVLGVPGAKNVKKEYKKYLDKFEKIYIHDEGDDGAKTFIKKFCQILPYEKLYKVSARAIDPSCKDLADLHVKGLLSEQGLIKTAIKIDKDYFDEVNNNDTKAEHVKISEEVLDRIYIKYYNENFFVYSDGVYKQNLPLVESTIQDIDRNSKKSLQSEVLNYIRIHEYLPNNTLETNLINFKNGIFNIETNTLQPHDPSYFTVCQLNANYLDDSALEKIKNNGVNVHIDKFLNDICCKKSQRIDCLLEWLGYSMTYSTELKKCLFILGESADNGKSTFLELSTQLFGEDNVTNTSIVDFSGRFFLSELVGKTLNVCHEMENVSLKDISKFKTIIAGNSLLAEEKYKIRFRIKPFTHHFFAMNKLPDFICQVADEGFFSRLHIIRFEAKFTDEQKNNFNFNNLLLPDSLDYLANIAIRKYMQMRSSNRREFSNYEESQDIISEYRAYSNSALQFIKQLHSSVFDANGYIKKTDLYQLYENWCIENHFNTMKKIDFYSSVLSTGKFVINKGQGGYDCFKKIGGDST